MIRPYFPTAAERADALLGTFTIRGETVALHVPIDWHQDPFGNRSWRMSLHALEALKPLLVHYQETDEVVALEHARDLALDWIDHNRRGARGLSEFAWYDMAVAYRAARLAYLYRALEYEQLMTADQRKRLGCSVSEHAYWLHDNSNYAYRNNHGLYSDASLFIVAEQLDLHPDADAWRRRATARFVENVTSTVSVQDGVHLEHSPAYHILISEILEQLINELGLGGEQLRALLEKMTAAAPWFVMPDGFYPQFGDTDLGRPSQWVLDAAGEHIGFKAFLDAGAAVYRDDASYFMTTAWYHSVGHKHADETSFVWAENGRRLIVDSGRYGYFYDEPGRSYAVSSPAHNTLTIDPPFRLMFHDPYGSGVIDAATSGGWHAVLLKNPLLSLQPLQYRRVFAYRPGRWLVVVDQLMVFGPLLDYICPTSTRRFHFAPRLEEAQREDSAVLLADDQDSVWLQTAAPPDELRAIRGQTQPTVQGFTFPSERNWVENTAVEIEARVCNEPMVVALSAGEETRPVLTATTQHNDVYIEIDDQRLRLEYGDDLLTLTVE
ncbi:MAG: heparinase II/III family protein [bacterium]